MDNIAKSFFIFISGAVAWAWDLVFKSIVQAPWWIKAQLGLFDVILFALAVYIVWDGIVWRRKAREIRRSCEAKDLSLWYGPKNGR